VVWAETLAQISFVCCTSGRRRLCSARQSILFSFKALCYLWQGSDSISVEKQLSGRMARGTRPGNTLDKYPENVGQSMSLCELNKGEMHDGLVIYAVWPEIAVKQCLSTRGARGGDAGDLLEDEVHGLFGS
jgi:hypothetical protein